MITSKYWTRKYYLVNFVNILKVYITLTKLVLVMTKPLEMIYDFYIAPMNNIRRSYKEYLVSSSRFYCFSVNHHPV